MDVNKTLQNMYVFTYNIEHKCFNILCFRVFQKTVAAANVGNALRSRYFTAFWH